MKYVTGKVIVITGAANGFGKTLATTAAKLGAKIVASDINEDALAKTVDEIIKAGGEAIAVTSDVTSANEMKTLMSRAVETYGAIDVLVNNAGIMPLGFFSDHKEAAGAWEKCIDINFKGALNGITAVYDQMIDQGRGQVINISSIYANHPVLGAAVYGATKAALVFLSEALRQEAHGRIRVTTVRPTGVGSTGIADAVVNIDAAAGILGSNLTTHGERMAKIIEEKAPPEWFDPESIQHFMIDQQPIVDQIIHAINQPWGICIGDITIRATGDAYAI